MCSGPLSSDKQAIVGKRVLWGTGCLNGLKSISHRLAATRRPAFDDSRFDRPLNLTSRTLAVCNKSPSKNSPYRASMPLLQALPAGAHPQKPRGSAGRLTAPRACALAKSQPPTRRAFLERDSYFLTQLFAVSFTQSSLLECIARSPHITSAPQQRLNPEPFLLRRRKSHRPPTIPAIMSEQQPQSRGGFRGRGARGDRGGRTGAPSSRSGAQKSGGGDTERPKKENILDLSKYLNKALRVKFSGGREGMTDLCLSLLLIS